MCGLELFIQYQSLGMDNIFHLTPFWACDYLSKVVLKLNHARNRGH